MEMPDKNTTKRTSYTVAQLLAAHRNFATPEGVENHHAIYSPAALLPELFGPEPPYNAIVAVAPRVKRPLSDLTDKPRTLQNTRSRDVAPRSRPTPTRGTRLDEEAAAAPRNWPGNGEEPLTSPGERFGSIDNWQELRRPTLRQQTQASRFSASDVSNHSDWRSGRNSGSTPHTAESWERLGQKLRQTGFKPGPDLSPAEMKRTDVFGEGSAEQKERTLSEVTALLKARYPEGITEDLINRLLRGDLAPRQAPPVPEATSRPICKAPPPATTTLTFQQLLQQTSGAGLVHQMPAEPSPTDMDPAAARLSLNEKIVRWSDLRPLFVVHIPKVAISVAKELAAARASAARSTSRDQIRSVYELYETRVARLYDELKKIRQVTLPQPLEAALKITPETSLALWPTFRELFMQTETMLHELQQWETAPSIAGTTTLLHDSPPIQHQPRPMAQPRRSESPVIMSKASPWKQPVGGPMSEMLHAYPAAAAPLPQQAPPVVSQQQAAAAASQRMFLKVDWEYLDPNQNVQGPFPSQRMYDWWRRDFFPADLPIRQNGRKKFIPLSTLYPPELHAQYSPFRDPWPVTLKDETPEIPPPAPLRKSITPPPQQNMPGPTPDDSSADEPLFASPPGSPRSPPRALPSSPSPPNRSHKDDNSQNSGPTGVVLRPAPPSTSSHESHSHHQPVWARKTTLEDAAAFERAANSESEGLGPSLAESRNDIAKPTVQGETQDGSKTSRKKVKGKKQPLSELLTAQNEQVGAVRSAWASQRSAVAQAAMRTGSEDEGSPSGVPSAVSNVSPRLAHPPSSVSDRKLVTDAAPLDPVQMKEVAQLCDKHRISLDRDFIGLLATMGSVQEMSSFLVDNLGSTAVQVDPFVQDFWDLIKNPFKPVVKGIVATAVSSRGGKKKSTKRR